MSIGQVLLSNTFNEFRVTVNDIANTVNDLTANTLSGSIVVDTVNANTGTINSLSSNTIIVGQVSSNLIPEGNSIHDLGSLTNRWKDLYLSGNTIFLGGAEISFDGSNVVFEVGGVSIFDTGDVSGGGGGNVDASTITTGTLDAQRLANSGAAAGTYGSASQVPVIVVDAKGRITSVSNTNVAGVTAVTYFEANTNLVVLTADGNNFTTSITPQNTAVTPGTYGSASQVPVLVIDAKGRITSASNTNVAGVTAFNYFTANTNLVINTADGNSFTASLGAASANGASTIVARDAAGSFAANVITSTTFIGDGSLLTGISAGGGLTISNDTTTDAAKFIPFFDANTGSQSTANVSSTKLFFNPLTGTLNATNLNSLSDITLKENLTIIQNPMSFIKNITGVEFNWTDTKQKSSGIVAQEIEKIIPHLVSTNNGLKSVNYNGLIGYLIETIKELNDRIEKLERK